MSTSERLQPRSAYERLLERVTAVARLHKRTAVEAGAGLLVWAVGLPLLAVVLLQYSAGLPFYLRALVLPAALIGLVWLGWKHVARPLAQRYSPTRAALLVEHAKPELHTKLVSALEIYPDLEVERPRFDRAMVGALVVQAQQSTAGDDFRQVIDRKPARKQLAAGVAVLVAWAVAVIADPAGIGAALWSMGTAWADMKSLAQRAAGAHIEVGELERAYLVGSTITIPATQVGFLNTDMTALVRNEGQTDWQEVAVSVSGDGRAEFKAADVKQTFEIYFRAAMIESPRATATVTERPRIASLTVEYQFPEYVRRAPVVQPRSDGNLKALYGSNVILTIEANKPLRAVKLTGLTGPPVTFSLGGRYASGVIKLDVKEWLATDQPIEERYRVELVDDYGFTNDDAERAYALIVEKDQPPTVTFVGLPHRSVADEPHVLEENLGSIPVVIKAADDYGISQVTLFIRNEDLETGATKEETTRQRQFVLPPVDLPSLAMLRLSDLGAKVGDRIVFYAQVQDGYDLETNKGPHIAKTPAYRVAVVTQEEMFSEVVYRDDWSTQWYDSLKVASLSNREIPARSSPTAEPATDAAKKLLDASQQGDSLGGVDQQLVQDYFDSLGSSEVTAP